MLLSFCILLGGCGVSDLDKEQTTDYLGQRYDRDFTFISSEERPRSQRNYLDERMEPLEETQEDANRDDIIDVYEDGNGVRFHVYHVLRYGVANSWVVTDDYAVQWLLSQPTLYTPLEQSVYNCTYYNTIGMGEERNAGFNLTVSCFDDIRPAAELAFDIIENDAAILPDKRQVGMESFRISIIPAITLLTEDGLALEEIRFRTEQMPQGTDKENFIRYAEHVYLGYVRDGSVKETLPEELLNRSYGENIPVYADGAQVAALVTDYWDAYCTLDAVALGAEMEFSQLRAICEYAGYHFKPDGDKLYITRDEDTILIHRRKGEAHDESVFSVWKNGREIVPEGELDDVLQEDHCRLSIADYQYLFGITIEVDYEEGKAVISKT